MTVRYPPRFSTYKSKDTPPRVQLIGRLSLTRTPKFDL